MNRDIDSGKRSDKSSTNASHHFLVKIVVKDLTRQELKEHSSS